MFYIRRILKVGQANCCWDCRSYWVRFQSWKL